MVRTVEAVVLSRRVSGEIDKCVRLLVKGEGKITALARGARKLGSRTSASTEPAVTGLFAIEQGRGMTSIRQAQPVSVRAHLRRSPASSAAALYLCDLADLVCASQLPRDDIYATLNKRLDALDSGLEPLWVMAQTETDVLQAEGVSPRLGRCLRCGGDALTADGRYLLAPRDGGCICEQCRRGQDRLMRLHESVYECWRSLAADDSDCRRPLDAVLWTTARAIHDYLKFHLDAEPPSSAVVWELLEPRLRTKGASLSSSSE